MAVEVLRVSVDLLRVSRRIRPTHIFLPDYQAVLRNALALLWLRARGVRVVARLGNAPAPGRFYRLLWRYVINPFVDRLRLQFRVHPPGAAGGASPARQGADDSEHARAARDAMEREWPARARTNHLRRPDHSREGTRSAAGRGGAAAQPRRRRDARRRRRHGRLGSAGVSRPPRRRCAHAPGAPISRALSVFSGGAKTCRR